MVTEFESFLDSSNWKSLPEHYKTISDVLNENIDKSAKSTLTQDARKWLRDNYEIKKEDLNLQEKLKPDLFNGQVVGVDGTCVDCDLLTGFQARIAIVAVNYKNNRTEYISYISQPFVDIDTSDIKDALEYLRLKGSGKVGITGAHIRSIMLYKEREYALMRSEKFKMVQGDILPYELRTGQGKLKGLPTCLAMGRKLLNATNIVAVQGTTSRPELRLIGAALQPGEYIKVYDYFHSLNAYLNGETDDSRGAHFNPSDKKLFEDFNSDAKDKYSVGIYKTSQRAYVFYAASSTFDTLANLAMLDSKYQPIRGFPLILDYADIICSRLFPAGEFSRIVDSKLARKKLLEGELAERSLRRR